MKEGAFDQHSIQALPFQELGTVID